MLRHSDNRRFDVTPSASLESYLYLPSLPPAPPKPFSYIFHILYGFLFERLWVLSDRSRVSKTGFRCGFLKLRFDVCCGCLRESLAGLRLCLFVSLVERNTDNFLVILCGVSFVLFGVYYSFVMLCIETFVSGFV